MAEIALTNGGVTLVDDEDAPRLSAYRWAGYTMRSNLRYAMTGSNEGRLYMHRVITDAPTGLDVDHISGDTLDNRKANLRVVTHQVNMRNRNQGAGASGVRNVFLVRGRFQVALHPKTGTIYVGTFDTLEAASEAAATARSTYYSVGTAEETLRLVKARIRYCCICRNDGYPGVAARPERVVGARFVPSVGRPMRFMGYVCESHLNNIINPRFQP